VRILWAWSVWASPSVDVFQYAHVDNLVGRPGRERPTSSLIISDRLSDVHRNETTRLGRSEMSRTKNCPEPGNRVTHHMYVLGMQKSPVPFSPQSCLEELHAQMRWVRQALGPAPPSEITHTKLCVGAIELSPSDIKRRFFSGKDKGLFLLQSSSSPVVFNVRLNVLI
jgi:hypothetical protein